MFKAAKCRFIFMLVTLAVLTLGVSMLGDTFATNVKRDGEEESLADGSNFQVALNFSRDKSNEISEYAPMIGTNAAAFTNSLLWCPGRTEIVYLEIDNNEAFPVDCTLSLNVLDSEFGNTLSYAVIDGHTTKSTDHPKNWTEFKNKATAHDTLNKGTHTLLNKKTLTPDIIKNTADAATGDTHYLALAIHMDENASSDYENAQMNFEFELRVDADYMPRSTPTPTP